MATPAQLEILLNGPALAPPKGVKPNFDDPPNLNTLSYILITIFILFPTVLLSMRLFTKARIVKSLALEDFIISLAWLFFVGFSVPSVMLIPHGTGLHQWDIRLRDLGYFQLLVLVGSALHGPTMFCVKFAILLQYLRIFAPQKKTNFIYWASHGLIWLNLVFYVICTFLELFPCKPISKAWKPLMTQGHCLNRLTINLVAAQINLSTDILCLILPQGVIWKLHMSLRRKLAISGVFLVGLLSCAVSSLRLYYTVVISQNPDYTYYLLRFGYCTFAELSSGFVACCLPTTPKFFQFLKQARLMTSWSNYVRTLVHRTGSGSHWRSHDYSIERASASLHTKDAKGRPGAYATLGENHEMNSELLNNRPNYIAKDNKRHGQRIEPQIMRTVHIASGEEPADDSILDIERGPVGPWDGDHVHHGQRTKIYT